MDITERRAALEPFDALIGTWGTEAADPAFAGSAAGGVVVYRRRT